MVEQSGDTKRKRKRLIIVICCLLSVLVLVGGAGLLFGLRYLDTAFDKARRDLSPTERRRMHEAMDKVREAHEYSGKSSPQQIFDTCVRAIEGNSSQASEKTGSIMLSSAFIELCRKLKEECEKDANGENCRVIQRGVETHMAGNQ